MKTSTLILATLLLAATVPLAKAEPFAEGWPRQPSGVVDALDPVTQAQVDANRAWEKRAFAEQARRGGCNADFVPTWVRGSTVFGGCYADTFGKSTEGGDN